jgi:hypothetical protein
MAELTLVEALGIGSTQTATEIIISKEGLATLLAAGGFTFTPKPANSVDEIFISFACSGLITMSPAKRAEDPVNRNIQFSYDPAFNFSSVTIDGQLYSQHLIEQAILKPIVVPKINPSDFGII